MREPTGTLLFQHIPKTAGTSLRHALASLYPEEALAFVYDPEDLQGAVSAQQFAALPPEERARLRFVMGHFPYGIHRHLDRPFHYVTILRDPVDRVASLYYHFKLLARPKSESKGSAERERIDRDAMSLADWVFDTKQLQVDNGMVRQIAARGNIPFGQCPDDLLTEALEHIDERYAAVLIRGAMAQSVQILEAIVGRPLPMLQRKNVNPGRDPLSAIDPVLRRRIRDLNALDAKLFQEMLQRFPATYERSVSSPRPTPRPRPDQSVETGERTLLFMHIAKTAGTSVRKTLADAYDRQERAFVYDPADLRGAISLEQFTALSDEDRARLRLVMGHFQYGLHRSLGRPFGYLTVLRDPVDRVVSLYYHYRHLRGLRIGGRAKQEQAHIRHSNMSLEEWVFGQQRLAVDNGMTRNIAARPRIRFGQCPDDLLDEAIEHIDRHFVAVLVSSELDRSLPLLEEVTGRSLQPVPHDNVNHRRLQLDELDPKALERIRELNRLDVRLYERARARLSVSAA